MNMDICDKISNMNICDKISNKHKNTNNKNRRNLM